MLGMGKAMSGYLASPLEQDSRNGLEKIKDGLLGAGGKEVEELVKEWAWHEGLERGGNGSSSSTPQKPSPENPSRRDELTTARLGHTPTISTPTSSSVKPPLVLSSRTDTGPLASLPRVPQTARSALLPSQGVTTYSRQADPLVYPPAGPIGDGEKTTSAAHKPATTPGDPLGVGP